MGQQLFKVHMNIDNNAVIEFDTAALSGGKDDISFFFPLESPEFNNDHRISTFQTKYTEQIRNALYTLTSSINWEGINIEMDDVLVNNIFKSINEQNKKIKGESESRLSCKQQLRTSLMKKVKDDDDNIIVLSEDNNDSDQPEQKAKEQSEQLSYSSIQSLMSIVLILIKSVEKNDPSIIQQILTVVRQLSEQLPIKSVSSTSNLVFKSWQPLINYIQELSLTTDPIISKQTIEILLRFFLAKGSLRNILLLSNRLIFNTTDIYNVKSLFIKMNNSLTKTIDDWKKQEQQTDSDLEKNQNTITEIVSLDYLKSLGSFPNTKLTKLNEELFTGQFISSIILSYIDIENTIYSPTNQSKLNSIFFDLHPDTFKHLFKIIDQLTTTSSSPANTTIIHTLTICLRLFTSHLQLLTDIKSDDNQIKLNPYVTDIELKNWFDLLLKLACDENPEKMIVCKEASKTLIYVINIRSSLTEKLSTYHQYIIENKHPIIIEQIFFQLNMTETLINWIELLCDENRKSIALDILYLFIDLYFNEEKENKSEIQQILLLFQQLLLYRLIDQCEKKNNEVQLSSLITEYLTYIFTKYVTKISITDELFKSIFTGLCLMTKTDKIVLYESIQPIFISILPLLAEYHLQHLDNEYYEFISILISKMSYVLIIGSPQDSLEIKYAKQLQLPIFSGGCIIKKNDYLLNSNLAAYSQFQLLNDINDDTNFLMSIHNNVDEGAQLIFKLKLYIKDKPQPILKSIDQQANDACAAIFAVYVKHYRRINLAKSELARTDQNKPYDQLLSLYQYANRIYTLFVTIKAQGGDCNDLYQQIKIQTLFLLLSVKENDLIPIITEDMFSARTEIPPDAEFHFQRQKSQWTKAKHILKLLRHLFQACFRFKNFMLEKRQANEEKYDYESLLKREIENFICKDFYTTPMSTTSEQKQLEIDALEKCLHRQHERAMIRLMTYRFIEKFLPNILNSDQRLQILLICLPYLKKNDLQWSYFDGIQASNNLLKEGISDTYCSIINLLLSPSLESQLLATTNFDLLNLSYTSIDHCHLYRQQVIEILFMKFVSVVRNSDHKISLNLNLIAFNWFRLFVFYLCENIQIDKLRKTYNQVLHQQQTFIFNSLILNELKQLKETLIKDSEESKQIALKNITLGGFLQAHKTNVSIISNQSQIELCINQYLVLLLRCIHISKDDVSFCANIDYLEECLSIYHHCQSNTTRFLVVKVLRYIISYIPDDIDRRAKDLIEKFLLEIISSIGENIIAEEILVELIYIYRRIMSIDSPWRKIAAEFIFDSIPSHLNFDSIETNDIHQMNKLLASLRILGGYIEPYRVGSIVKVKGGNETNDESSLALIIEINSNMDSEEASYIIEYLQTGHIESMTIGRMQLQIDVPPLNLLFLPISKDSILDKLGYCIQIDTSTSESVMLLELKRRCVSILYHLLNDTTSVKIFMEKPYASAIAKLCVSDSLRNIPDLRAFNKEHLEQYCLSLDRCERFKQIIETDNKDSPDGLTVLNDRSDLSNTILNVNKINRDPLIIDVLSVSVTKYSGWKPYATEEEIEYIKRGRHGNDDISLVPIPRHMINVEASQICGTKHRFRGRIELEPDDMKCAFPTFIIDNLQLSEGKWYYCVRLPVAGLVQIGWATNGFSPSCGPQSDISLGVGDDWYSWSYDGSRAVFFYVKGFEEQFNNIRWKANDICGCGIEIDGENTKIKYWLNGELLGTAFAHNTNISLSTMKCNLLPNGSTTTYFPSVTLWRETDVLSCFELIVSPEDMQDCPLPSGYKPLLLPKIVRTENSIVDYPFNAYLVGNNPDDYFLTKETEPATNVLRDFVNEHHLPIPDKNNGLLLPIDNDEESSFTVSFDFQILSIDEKPDILLFKIDSIEIKWSKSKEKTRCVIVVLSKKREIKVYTNDDCQTFTVVFPYETITKQNIHILPGIAAEIDNVAIWKYALSEEHIHRLFIYGLFFVANDYQQLKQHKKQNKTISFSKNQHAFTDKSLVLLDKPFTEELWKKKKEEDDDNQSEYIKSYNDADHSTVQLYGNETYLVLDKTTEEWSEYTLILDFSIPQRPSAVEKLTVIKLNALCDIYIAHNGKLCLMYDGKGHKSDSTINPNEYFRLCISARRESISIYVNNKLEISIQNNKYQFQIDSNRIDLFHETLLILNTTSKDTLRVSVKSIIHLNRSITIDELQSSTFDTLPFTIIGHSLIAMGYKKSWIQSVIKQNKATHISTIHQILRKQKQDFIKADLENERKHFISISSRLNPSMDLANSSNLGTNEMITNITQHFLTHWSSSHASTYSMDETAPAMKFDIEWLSQVNQNFDIHHDITDWIRDKVSMADVSTNVYRLLDLNQSEQDSTTIQTSLHYSHQNISSKQYLESRIACEHGLTTIYARHAILNMLKVWSYDQSTLFPYEKLGDYTFLITLLKQLDCTEKDKNEKIDQIDLLIYSILKNEIKQLVEHTNTMNIDILPSNAPLLYHLQKDMIIQSIQFIFKPSLFNRNESEEIFVNGQQPKWNFILKILNFFKELITDRSILTQQQIDSIIPIVFSTPIINLIFNLLLSVPAHSSKIVFLHLFTILIQTSKHFHLPNDIQQYFLQSLIKLSHTIEKENETRNKLYVALIDLIFVLLTKQELNENQRQEILSKLPEDIRHLFITIHLITTWNNQTNETLLLELFLEKSGEILGDTFKLNQDDFKKSNDHFNVIADQELLTLMNKSSLSEELFIDFIANLSTESEPNPTLYKSYPTLSNIPYDCIQIRARFIFLLNIFVKQSLSLIDLSLLPGQSNLTDQIQTIKFYILATIKFPLLNESLERNMMYNFDQPVSIYFDTVKASRDNENTMFHQAYQQLHTQAHYFFRQSLEQLWLAEYVDMHSTDAGGPYRDSITRMCSDICSTRLPLFILCPNGRTNSGLNRDCWIPNVFPPNQSITNQIIKQYRFIGQLMGIAVTRRHYLNLKFPRLVWKLLLREEISIEDIESIDTQSFSFINEMEKNIEQIKLTEDGEDIDSIFSSIMSELHFDVVSSSGQTYELIPGGTEIPITAKNFKPYCSSYRQYRLNEFNRQIDYIRQGLCSVISYFYLSLFTAMELEKSVCGESQVDVEFLKRNTYYRGDYDQNSPVIERFWTVLGKMFNNDQRKLFLIFVWGRDTLPTNEKDFIYKFQINTFDVAENKVDKTLPRSHTCYFILDLPAYSTTEIMYERLNYAITSCPSIDGDGIEMNGPNTETIDNNDI